MKKIFSIVLLFTLIAPFATSFIWLKYEQKMIRKEAKRKILSEIKLDELCYFALTKTESKSKLEWEHSKEFEFKGEMYDVVKKITIDDSLFMWCWHDAKETQLNKKLQTLVLKSYGNPLKNTQKHQNIGFLFKITGIHNLTQQSVCESFKHNLQFIFKNNLHEMLKMKILSPPPENLV